MSHPLATSIFQQSTSFALAAVVTLAMLGGVDLIARSDVQPQVDAASHQIVVITASRSEQS